jgi:hypothetical protein
MKKLFLAGVIVTLTTMSAQAEGTIRSGIMSMFKPKTWVGDIGATANISRFSIRPALDWGYSSGNSFSVSGASVKSTMAISRHLSAYSKLSLDGDFKYSDISVGMSIVFK